MRRPIRRGRKVTTAQRMAAARRLRRELGAPGRRGYRRRMVAKMLREGQ